MSDNSLKPEDCFLVVKFAGLQSAAITTFHPNNVSAAQMFLIAEMLRWQANHEMDRQAGEKEEVQNQNKILVPKVGLIQ